MTAFLRVIIDMSAGTPLDGTVAFVPSTLPVPKQPDHLLVVHDSNGDIIVRAFHPTSSYVIGRARWDAGAMQLVDAKGIQPAKPSPEQWQTIAQVLAPLVHIARARHDYPSAEVLSKWPWVDEEPLDPEDTPRGRHLKNLRDHGRLPSAPGNGADPDFLERHWIVRNVVQTIGAVLLFVGMGIGLFLWHRLGGISRGSVANGRPCTGDYACRSDLCYDGVCQAVDKRKGEPCRHDLECASHRCRSAGLSDPLCD